MANVSPQYMARMAALVMVLGIGGASTSLVEAAACATRGRFQPIVRAIPQVVGDCTSAETYDASTGDVQQATTRGELRTRGADGALLFTESSPNGQTWILGPNGVESRPHGSRLPWEGPAPLSATGTWDVIGPESPPDLIGPPSVDQTVVDSNANENTNTLANTNTVTATGGNATGGNANAQGGSSTNANSNAVNPSITVGVNVGAAQPPMASGVIQPTSTPIVAASQPGQTLTPTPVQSASPTVAATPFARPTPGGPADGLPTLARIELASGGTVSIALNTSGAPQTVRNFANKVASGFYDGLTFHRVEDWVVQGGDPTGTGQGGGTYPTELNDVPFRSGSIGMARGSDPTISNDAQFFIVKRDAPHLNGKYANFGQVTSGMDTIARLAVGDKIARITVGP